MSKPICVRRGAIHFAAVTLAFWCSAHAAEAPVRELTLNIQAQPMEDALNQFAQQTGLQVLVSSQDVLGGASARRVVGSFTADAALEQLLAESGLRYEFVNPRTVAIRPLKRVEESDEKSTAEVSGAEMMRLVQESPSSQVSDGQTNPSSAAPAVGTSIEEIVVTAQKREERLQDVPISISVLRGEDLDRSTAQGVTEMLSRVPGMGTVEHNQGGQTQLAMRGVTAASGNFFGSSPVGYYLDSAPFGFVKSSIVPNPDVYDLERIEVLRGPQGTLYGVNAQNGVVRVLTKDANPRQFEFKTRAMTSSTQDGGWNYRGDAAINVPIVKEKLAARAVLGYQDWSGWLEKPNKEDFNDSDVSTMRLKINAEPTEQLSVGLSAWFSRSDFGGPSTANDDGLRRSPAEESISTDFDIYTVKIGYDFSGFSLTSMSSYIEFANHGVIDASFNGTNFLLSDFDAKTFAQEVNLASTHDGVWRWTAGGIFRNSEDEFWQSLTSFGPFPTGRGDTSKSWAIFGELTRVFADGRFELTGGLRYFEDDITGYDYSRLGVGPPAIPIGSRAKFDALSPRVIFSWHPSEEKMLYASYSEGFRSGFYQNPQVLEVAPDFPPAEPDTLENYEMGAKGSLWNGAASFDLAVYYIDWRKVQQPLFREIAPGVTPVATINGESASGLGADIGLSTRPVEGLELAVNFSWNDLTMDADLLSAGFVLFDKGERLNLSAEYTAGASLTYAFPLGRAGYTGHFSASANRTSAREWRTIVGVLGRHVTQGDPMMISRTAFSIESPSGWMASLYIDNANNEQGRSALPPFGPTNLDFASRIRPRTFGLQIDYRL